jgi:hypothetical protein
MRPPRDLFRPAAISRAQFRRVSGWPAPDGARLNCPRCCLRLRPRGRPQERHVVSVGSLSLCVRRAVRRVNPSVRCIVSGVRAVRSCANVDHVALLQPQRFRRCCSRHLDALHRRPSKRNSSSAHGWRRPLSGGDGLCHRAPATDSACLCIVVLRSGRHGLCTLALTLRSRWVCGHRLGLAVAYGGAATRRPLTKS